MEPTATAALIFLLCSQIQNTGALPVRNNLADYQHDASGNEKEGSFVKETVAAMTGNENPPCQIVPVTDDALTGITSTPPPPLIPANTPRQVPHTIPPPAPNPAQDTHHKPPLLPPNVFYQPIVPYYVLPHNPVSGGSHVYGQGAGNAGFVLPHSPSGASGFLPPPQWFLDLQRGKHLSFLQNRGNPTGNQRGSLPAGRLHSSSSEMSSEEDSEGD